jgi:hypothetical protein
VASLETAKALPQHSNWSEYYNSPKDVDNCRLSDNLAVTANLWFQSHKCDLSHFHAASNPIVLPQKSSFEHRLENGEGGFLLPLAS